MTDPAARGERFLATAGDALWVSEVARILHDGLGAAGKRVPTHEIPNVVVRLLGLFNPSVRPMLHDLGVQAAQQREGTQRVGLAAALRRGRPDRDGREPLAARADQSLM